MLHHTSFGGGRLTHWAIGHWPKAMADGLALPPPAAAGRRRKKRARARARCRALKHTRLGTHRFIYNYFTTEVFIRRLVI